MSNSRVKYADVTRFLKEYEAGTKHAHLRLGQAFINEFVARDGGGDLFYEQNYFAARNIIFAEWVDFE